MLDIFAAHRHSSQNREEIRRRSGVCGCFSCLSVFHPDQVTDWCDDGETALCPRCGVDAVIGSGSGYPVDDEDFLRAMYLEWFTPPLR